MAIQEFNTNDLCLFASDLMSELPDGAINSIHIYPAANEIELSVNASQELMACLYKMAPSRCVEVAGNGILIWGATVLRSPNNITLNIKIYM